MQLDRRDLSCVPNRIILDQKKKVCQKKKQGTIDSESQHYDVSNPRLQVAHHAKLQANYIFFLAFEKLIRVILFLTKAGSKLCLVAAEEDAKEATASLATANKISMDEAILSEPQGIFTLMEEQRTTKKRFIKCFHFTFTCIWREFG